MKQEKYLNSIKFLDSLINISGPDHSKNKERNDRSVFIKRLKFLLNLLGHPEKNFKYLHITGTSGKSSLAFMIQSIMVRANIKTGGFFSPHVTSITERIRAGSGQIPPTDFSRLVDCLKPYLAQCAKSNPYGVPSYFETLMAIAFLYFKEKKCEYAVLETGVGSDFDATNIIPRAEITIITNIGSDHNRILGKTKIKIAQSKTKIIKNNPILLTGEKNQDILKVFKKICRQKGGELKKVDFNFKIINNDLPGTKFKYKNNFYKTKIGGEHQIKNAILAIEAVSLIKNKKIGQRAIKAGLAETFLPCRLEIVQKKPIVILDGAHNPDKMKATADFIKNIKFKKLHLIIGLAEDKKLYNTLKYIIPLADQVYLTRFLMPSRKSKNLREMHKAAKKLTNKKIKIFIDPWQALAQALKKARKNDMILITGSFFLAGELRKKWLTKSRTF